MSLQVCKANLAIIFELPEALIVTKCNNFPKILKFLDKNAVNNNTRENKKGKKNQYGNGSITS